VGQTIGASHSRRHQKIGVGAFIFTRVKREQEMGILTIIFIGYLLWVIIGTICE
jgi:hypothetical protein